MGPFFNGGSAGTSSTGPHIGQLVVQDISATSATLAGPVTGIDGTQSAPYTVTLNHLAGYGGVVITPASTGTGDTFQATSGGGNVTTITIPAGSSSGTFYLTPNTAGSDSVSITTNSSLTLTGSPITVTVGSTSAATLTLACVNSLTDPPLAYQVPFTLTLDNPAPVGGIVVTLASTGASDTFQTSVGGGNITTMTIAYGASKTYTFYMTPGGYTGSRQISVASSPPLTYSGALGFSANPAGQYLLDTFSGSAGPLSSHTSDSGATWVNGPNMDLDGSGYVYNTSTGLGTIVYPTVAMPASYSAGFEVVFK